MNCNLYLASILKMRSKNYKPARLADFPALPESFVYNGTPKNKNLYWFQCEYSFVPYAAASRNLFFCIKRAHTMESLNVARLARCLSLGFSIESRQLARRVKRPNEIEFECKHMLESKQANSISWMLKISIKKLFKGLSDGIGIA